MAPANHANSILDAGTGSLSVKWMEAPGGVEPPTNGLGNRCSIQLSYGARVLRLRNFTLHLSAQDILSVRENN